MTAKKLALLNQMLQSQNVVLVGPILDHLPPEIKNITIPKVALDSARFLAPPDFWDYTIGDDDGDTPHRIDSKTYPLDETYPVKKEKSDFLLALDIFSSFETMTIEAWGLLHGKSDYQMANLGDAYGYVNNKPSWTFTFMSNQKKVITIFSKKHIFEHHGRFSLFSFKPNQVTISGDCEYPCQELDIELPSSHLLSNVARGKVVVTSIAPLILYLDQGIE